MPGQAVIPDRALLDSAVPLHALGGASAWREPAVRVLSLAAAGDIELLASTELIQEFVFHRLRRGVGRAQAVAEAESLMELVTIVSFDGRALAHALGLIRDCPGARGRDAVHAATALANGIDTIISPDPDFDAIPGLTRIDPANLTA